jgi:plastocyanin
MKTKHYFFLSFILTLAFGIQVSDLQAKKWLVTVKNYSFTPYNLTHVKAGDTIQFQWVEGIHTTTSTSIPQDALEWDYPLTQQEPFAMVIPKVNGTYKYISTPDSSAGMDGTFTVSGALGVPSPNDKPDIRLFPNPAGDQINVMTTNHDIVSLRIFDIRGIKVGEFNFGNQTGQYSLTIDLRSLQAGIFFFEFTLESGKKRIVRVVHSGK